MNYPLTLRLALKESFMTPYLWTGLVCSLLLHTLGFILFTIEETPPPIPSQPVIHIYHD